MRVRADHHGRERGAVLIMVLALATLLAVLSATMLRVAGYAVHSARDEVEYLRTFHAADAALMVCEQRVREAMTARVANLTMQPDRMRHLPGRIVLHAWPDTARAPECTINRVDATWTQPAGYRIEATARMARSTTGVSVRLDLWIRGGRVHTRWSSIGSYPYRRRLRLGVHRASQGFTLMEALVAMAIAAMIASYAIPAYLAHETRAYRTIAALGVRHAMLWLDRRAIRDRHQSADVSGSTEITLPDDLASLPPGARRSVYRLRAETASDGGYFVTAIPVETGPMRSDACGEFVLDASGRMSNTGPADVDECWYGR